jgi:phosphoenolpyruvate carboxykinase (GTP)
MSLDMILKSRFEEESLKKLKVLNNVHLEGMIAEAILKYQPRSVFLSDGSHADMQRIRRESIRRGEERPLLVPVHTVHYDGYEDQGRDPANTLILTSDGASLSPGINTKDAKEGRHEIEKIMNGIMLGKDMVISFYSLGPLGTEFAIPCVQITDSFYVAHSEDILYRQGYALFKDQKREARFFGFLHSSGALKRGVSRDIDHRRIYIDLENHSVCSANTQYAGNTVAAKKLAHRLAIKQAAREGWLAEHLFISGVPSYEGDKTCYIAGAFPSWCGKTSTSMLFNVVGDDLAHLRKKGGVVQAANVEKGMFGVIKDVNLEDDPYIYQILIKPGEIIFSNVLDVDGKPFWQGMGKVDIPLRGSSHSGPWWQGKRDANKKLIPLSHDNARFCVALQEIKNYDPTQVVDLDGIIYGGRSSKRPVPVSQSYGWVHGVYYGASIESEPTAATVGQASPKVIINPMANQEFLSIPTGTYLTNHIKFGEDLKERPKVFYVNYFLRDEAGEFLNTKMDKKVWIRWIERRLRGSMGAVATPTGFIPKYQDLADLFQRELNTEYSNAEYERQFTIRTPELLDKLDVVQNYYTEERKTSLVPEEIFRMIQIQRELLTEVRQKLGDYVSPFKFEGYEVPIELTRPF